MGDFRKMLSDVYANLSEAIKIPAKGKRFIVAGVILTIFFTLPISFENGTPFMAIFTMCILFSSFFANILVRIQMPYAGKTMKIIAASLISLTIPAGILTFFTFLPPTNPEEIMWYPVSLLFTCSYAAPTSIFVSIGFKEQESNG